MNPTQHGLALLVEGAADFALLCRRHAPTMTDEEIKRHVVAAVIEGTPLPEPITAAERAAQAKKGTG